MTSEPRRRRLGAYAPLSATYASDDAILEAGEKAELLYVRGVAWCAARPQQEGFISDAQLTLAGHGLTGLKARAKTLVDVGLWERVDGGWAIRAWLKWNRSASEIEREQAKDRARKATPKPAPLQSDSSRIPDGNQTEDDRIPPDQPPDSLSPRAQPSQHRSSTGHIHSGDPTRRPEPTPPPDADERWMTQLADELHQRRPDWDTPGIHAAITRTAARPGLTPARIRVAAHQLARDPAARTPALLPRDGQHWTAPTPTDRDAPRCREHPTEPAHACRSCRADRLVGDVA